MREDIQNIPWKDLILKSKKIINDHIDDQNFIEKINLIMKKDIEEEEEIYGKEEKKEKQIMLGNILAKKDSFKEEIEVVKELRGLEIEDTIWKEEIDSIKKVY